MSKSSIQRARELFGQALDLPSADREAWIRSQTDAGEEATGLALELLEQHEELPEGFMETPPPVLPAGLESMLQDGLLFGDFQLKSVLGSGGSGVVYLAQQRSLERDVALKVFRPFTEDSERAIARFLAEAKSAARLRHPGIAQVYTASSQNGIPYFSMEYVPGRDLATCITEIAAGEVRSPFHAKDSPEYFDAAARIIHDCADALAHAHENGVLHRDIKPENILVDVDGRPKVVDFGLARDEQLGRHSKTGVIEGTPHYMSPEQARAARDEIDERTDVYSLGVVLFELLTLQRPFGEGTLAEILQRVATQEPPLAHSLNRKAPSDLAAVCMKAMHRGADQRYQDSASFKDDLALYLSKAPTAARPPGVAQLVGRTYRINRRKFLAGSLITAASLAGVRANQWISRSNGKCRLSISGADQMGRQLNGRVQLLHLDWITGEVTSRNSIGTLPITNRYVHPGYYRVRVRTKDRLVELIRELTAESAIEIVVPPAPPEDLFAREDWVRVQGGRFKIPEDLDTPPPWNGLEAKVDSFSIGKYEVSNRQYRRFLEANPKAKKPDHWHLLSRADDHLPIAFVSWNEAVMFCEWSGTRLPSYLEWTLAMRSKEMWIFPWQQGTGGVRRGNTLRAAVQGPRNSLQDSVDFYRRNVAPVNSFPEARTPSGVFHGFGNVSEWTETAPFGPVSNIVLKQNRIVTGHEWDAFARNTDLRTYSMQLPRGEETREPFVGIRCVMPR